MRKAWTAWAAVVAILCAASADAADQTVHDIFVNGKLARGVQLVNGRVAGNEIETASLGAGGWAKPMFEVRGLNIDISKVDLAQVRLRMVCTGNNSMKPGYADIQVHTTKMDGELHITQFPFRAYIRNENYMTRSADHSELYAKHPKGADYGAITGFAVKTSGGFSMRFSTIQVLIDKSMDAKYPDDPKPEAKWRGGKITDLFAVSVSDRVFLDELDSPLKKANTVWKDGTVRLSGARNETVAFQVVMQTAKGPGGVNDVNVRFDGVKKGTACIDNAKAVEPGNPYNYVGRYVQLYRTRYVLYDRVDDFGGQPAAQGASQGG